MGPMRTRGCGVCNFLLTTQHPQSKCPYLRYPFSMAKKRILLGFFLSIFVVNLVQAEDLFFDSNGVKIHYTVQGKGEPVVLIHGYAVNIPLNWGAVLPGLAGNYQVIAIDNRGHGKSDKPHDAASYNPKLMAGDTIHLMDHLKIRQAHIVGYSMGGFLTSVI